MVGRRRRGAMNTGVFLDVDECLTTEPINMQFARIFGIEDEHHRLEERYRDEQLTNEEFNKDFIPLFRRVEFSQRFVTDHFDHIRLRAGHERLLRRSDPPFLVTSGPSYYMDILAERRS